MLLLSQIWTFLRTDVTYEKQPVLAIRPEKLPSLKPATVHFIANAVHDCNVGVAGERKDFLDSVPKDNTVITKVSAV